MSHKNVTHSPVDSMPRIPHTIRRNGRYHFNFRIPTELRALYGKTTAIRESLGTSDYREARREAQFRVLQAEAEFDEKRKMLRVPAIEPKKLVKISEQEAHRLVFQFLRESEKDSEKWWAQDGSKLEDKEREQVLENLQFDEAIYSGGIRSGKGERTYAADDASSQLDAFLKAEVLECPKGSPAYDKLRALFHLAVIENIQRNMDRLAFRGAQVHQPLFREVFAHTAPPKSNITLGELVKRYKKEIENRSESTKKTYQTPMRLLCEVFGETKRLDEITPDEAERLLGLLRHAPINATKFYPKMTLEEAIEAADREGNTSRLSPKSLKNYFININGIFNYATGKKLIAENPFKDRYLRNAFITDADEKEKAHFTTEQLNKLFSAPLYTGCKNDQKAFAKVGPNKPRRGRFWVPLLALFHGFRLGEVAQLYTEDVGDEGGIPFLYIRETRADGSKCDKHLKTKQSKRRVPLHPELVKIGFLDFVATRRQDAEHARLFPELKSSGGYFSNSLSDWFGGFKAGLLGAGCKATFHSFRHHFRTALGEAGVPIADVEALGGWDSDGRSSEKRYDRATLQRLYTQMLKVKYPSLDLSHLHANTKPLRASLRLLDLD